ncbi:GatB/YqeY domain-containing protein [Sedimenticola selenatireducens]|uniref:GatB/YqeY domain-containing protein n=1 Tax=Sedimenticola selenatireducens TaxID=191960 RepID=A0A558DNT0_9GAMM|nr:GatB/YqeY domain-containing protein [Sedimenticola selenatireducens]TVO78456.1 GatB/YqeY domain-containing protein [Sedimenticola selenatireducens]TVT62685.1 MAG: GatB/YqeY domain-containing protein [Sedimenticola selenatireducens]
MLKQRIQDDMKASMKGGDKPRLGVIRLLMAAIKQREVDERIELDDTQILVVLDKMVKQRRDSITQYEQAGRTELAEQEAFEITILQDYLPTALTEQEITDMIKEAIQSTGAESIRDMGKVMGQLKPKMQGRADMGAVSGLIKQQLSS